MLLIFRHNALQAVVNYGVRFRKLASICKGQRGQTRSKRPKNDPIVQFGPFLLGI